MNFIYEKRVKKWDVLEVRVDGPSNGNPFIDQFIYGIFQGKNEKVKVDGFYDGDGVYCVRFMPSFEGEYNFTVRTSFLSEELFGSVSVVASDENNHGPVRVASTFHFTYEDGTPYYSIGTTCYVWELQSDECIKQTFETLKNSSFNKIRFCIFPKHYAYNLTEPRSYPYEGTPMDSSVLTVENFNNYTRKANGSKWDFNRFNPKHFQHIEKCIQKLGELGIEADIIVMHPYDRWGFSLMTQEQDDRYWKYVIARFSAYHNIWWSLANEFDQLTNKTISDWERYAQLICTKDPYNHLRSIHHSHSMYDYNRPWITHCSLQRQECYRTAELVDSFREKYRKPVVMDEIAYEGNLQFGWGNISAEEMVRRFWEVVCRGGYPGHGETYFPKEDGRVWWSHGGVLYGESWKRFGFLLDIMKETPGLGLAPYPLKWDCVAAVPECEWKCAVKSYYLIYFSFMQPSLRDFYFDDCTDFEVEVIDTWNMTINKVGIFHGKFYISLPGKPYIAVRLKRV